MMDLPPRSFLLLALALCCIANIIGNVEAAPRSEPRGSQQDQPSQPNQQQHHQQHRAEGWKLGAQESRPRLTSQMLRCPQSNMVYWSERFEFYACFIPKCASSSWQELLYQMHLNATEMQEWRSIKSVERIKSYPADGIMHRSHLTGPTADELRAEAVLSDPRFFKFTVVRHPWNRLVSGYLNKYVIVCKKDRACFQRLYLPELNTQIHEPMSLTELLLTLEHLPLHHINKHYRPSVEICNVRHGPYDFVADMENPAHTEYILAKIKSPLPLPISKNSLMLKKKADSAHVACTRETVDLAARIYKNDLDTYGFSLDAAYESCEKYGIAHPPE
jgi:hypothetical protein